MKNLRNWENRYSGMTYLELMRSSDKAKSGKDARLIHRELKKYGDGLLLWHRYPALLYIGAAALDVVISIGAVRLVLRTLGIS